MIYIYIWYMCQICERVTLARLSCPERSRPKDGVSPIVVVVPVADLAACSDVEDSVQSILWQAEPWLMLMCDFRRKEQHCSAPAGPRVLHWALVTIHAAIEIFDILNWWWRPFQSLGPHEAIIDWRTEEWGTQLVVDLAWPIGPIAGCCRLPGSPRSQVPGPRRGRLEEKVEATQAEGAQILNEARHLQHFPNTVLLDLWYYWYLWCSEIASKSTQKRKNKKKRDAEDARKYCKFHSMIPRRTVPITLT